MQHGKSSRVNLPQHLSRRIGGDRWSRVMQHETNNGKTELRPRTIYTATLVDLEVKRG